MTVPDLSDPSRFHMILGLFDTPYRRAFFDFSDPLYKLRLQGVRPAMLPQVTTDSLRKGKTMIFVQQNEAGWEYAISQLKEAVASKRVRTIHPESTNQLPEYLDPTIDWVSISDELSCVQYMRGFPSKKFRLAFAKAPDMFGACIAVKSDLAWDMNALNKVIFSIRNRESYLLSEADSIHGYEDIIERFYQPRPRRKLKN